MLLPKKKRSSTCDGTQGGDEGEEEGSGAPHRPPASPSLPGYRTGASEELEPTGMASRHRLSLSSSSLLQDSSVASVALVVAAAAAAAAATSAPPPPATRQSVRELLLEQMKGLREHHQRRHRSSEDRTLSSAGATGAHAVPTRLSTDPSPLRGNVEAALDPSLPVGMPGMESVVASTTAETSLLQQNEVDDDKENSERGKGKDQAESPTGAPTMVVAEEESRKGMVAVAGWKPRRSDPMQIPQSLLMSSVHIDVVGKAVTASSTSLRSSATELQEREAEEPWIRQKKEYVEDPPHDTLVEEEPIAISASIMPTPLASRRGRPNSPSPPPYSSLSTRRIRFPNGSSSSSVSSRSSGATSSRQRSPKRALPLSVTPNEPDGGRGMPPLGSTPRHDYYYYYAPEKLRQETEKSGESASYTLPGVVTRSQRPISGAPHRGLPAGAAMSVAQDHKKNILVSLKGKVTREGTSGETWGRPKRPPPSVGTTGTIPSFQSFAPPTPASPLPLFAPRRAYDPEMENKQEGEKGEDWMRGWCIIGERLKRIAP